MKRIALIPALFAAFFIPLFAEGESADAGGVNLKGAVVNALGARHYVDGTRHRAEYAGYIRAQLNAQNAHRRRAKAEADVDLTLFYGAYADRFVSPFAYSSNETPSVRANAFSIDLRKLYVALYPDFGDFTFGRQIVNIGVGTLFSPVDTFSKTDLSDLAMRRIGSDIIMARFYFADFAGLDLATTFSTTMDDILSMAKLYANFFEFDFALIGLYETAENTPSAGLSFKGTLKAGVYGEAIAHYSIETGTVRSEAMIGIDYSFFSGNLLLLAEYYYNDLAVNADSMTLPDILSYATRRQFFSRHYAFFSGTYMINELMSAGVAFVYNVSARASMTAVTYTASVFQNAALALYVRYYNGDLNGIDTKRLTGHNAPRFDYSLEMKVSF